MQNSTPLAWLIGNEGKPDEIHFALIGSESTLGRGSDCEVQVDDELVSRKHALISYCNGNFEIEDLGSSNGTFINNNLISSGLIRNGDLIQVGDTVLQFKNKLDPDTATPQTKAPQEPIAAASETAPQMHDYVHCSWCGQKNPATDKLCSKCNAVLPQLPENFQFSLNNFKMTQADFSSGKITEEDYHKVLAELVVQDRSGDYWMLGVVSGDWYWHDGKEWHKKTPPLISSDENHLPIPDSSEKPVQQPEEKPPRKPSMAGRWVAIGLWLLSLVIILGFGLDAVMKLVSFLEQPGDSQPVSEQSPNYFDSSISPDTNPGDDLGSQSTKPAASGAVSSSGQASSEIIIRTYNPGTDSSLSRFTAETVYQSDQSGSEYYLYEGFFPADTPAILVMGWCAIDQDTLNENMSKIELSGIFDNQVIPQNSWTQENTQVDDMFCRFFRAVVEGLEPGTHHYLWSTSYNDPVNDGWQTFPPGNYISEYIVEVGGQ